MSYDEFVYGYVVGEEDAALVSAEKGGASGVVVSDYVYESGVEGTSVDGV